MKSTITTDCSSFFLRALSCVALSLALCLSTSCERKKPAVDEKKVEEAKTVPSTPLITDPKPVISEQKPPTTPSTPVTVPKPPVKPPTPVQVVIGKRPLDFTAPIHYLSHNVEANYATTQAIPNPGVIAAVTGTSISIQSHPENASAQLRVIQLPKSIQAKEETARILAESGAIQDCDILLSFRPRWAAFNGYCNVQMGISHVAMATIDSTSGTKFVQTVESPLNYCSRLDYKGHYVDLELMHILRPTLSEPQKKNVKDWALRTMSTDKSRITFFGDYGMPYQNRKLAAPATGNLPLDLAKTVIHPKGGMSVAVYCSELGWALLALRDINPAELEKEFPDGSGKDPSDWIKSKLNPMFQPFPGATGQVMKSPGLMQGPDVQMRTLYGTDDAKRRKFLLDKVLLTKVTNPAETEGHLSTGHAMAANIFLKTKLPKLRDYYGTQKESASLLPGLNNMVNPNYSPTAFFALCNLPKESRNFSYVATLSFLPLPGTAPAVATPNP